MGMLGKIKLVIIGVLGALLALFNLRNKSLKKQRDEAINDYEIEKANAEHSAEMMQTELDNFKDVSDVNQAINTLEHEIEKRDEKSLNKSSDVETFVKVKV